jgi:hypothetical protein
MNTRYFKISLHTVMGGIAALFLTGAFAADVPTHKVVDGVAIYLGVLPSEMVLGHPHSHTEAGMHGGVPVGEHRYHVLVALFDAASGKRITDAQVKARYLSSPVRRQRKLEPMHIADTITYGNYSGCPAPASSHSGADSTIRRRPLRPIRISTRRNRLQSGGANDSAGPIYVTGGQQKHSRRPGLPWQFPDIVRHRYEGISYAPRSAETVPGKPRLYTSLPSQRPRNKAESSNSGAWCCRTTDSGQAELVKRIAKCG